MMVKIFADSRETTSGMIKALQAMENVEVLVGELPCGDYVLSQEVVVERKEAQDFVNSIMDGRLFNQVPKMKMDYVRPMVLIEGDVYKTRSKMTKESIRGALSWLMAIANVQVIFVADKNESLLMLAHMARHLQEGLGYEINLHPKKPKANADSAQYVIGSFPGIGPENSKKLFEHFGSIARVVNATPEMITQINGIGPTKAKRFHELVHYESEIVMI
jgi:Fanconi anemia group M protein